MTLDEIRAKIDEIDHELIPLIKKRMECSLAVA
ncbi:MAG: chorismate mutase, partial [Clostridia bacterium]|nr:chorismate mutase [Clostridia bacterium]